MDSAAAWPESQSDPGRPMGDGSSEPNPDDPESPSGPGALEPAESDTMRRLRAAMVQNRHHH